MPKYFKDYCWKEGVPLGIEAMEEITSSDTYKIVADPYNKRIAIERYVQGQFTNVLYDSIFLDFRHLKKPDQTAWQKIPILEEKNKTVCLIRNQDDRVLYIETHFFEDNICKECMVESPQGVKISKHKMFYSHLGDPFNGVVLFDTNEHPVMYNRYEFDDISQQFTTLLEEQWNIENGQSHLFKSASVR